jgi:chemosensory pili system protein ChpB (putative protein-glutamate methylesterase)
VAEAAPVASALRVALLARPGPAADRLRATLAGIGTELVFEADPVEADPRSLADAAPQAVVVVLDPAVEDVLDRYDPVLGDPAVDVLYEEADLAAAREGWDAARWGRHLSAKLLHHGDVLPPGREADAEAGGDVPDLQPGRPPTPAQLAEDRPEQFDQADAARMASQVPFGSSLMFDPVAAEYGAGGDETPAAPFDLGDGFEADQPLDGDSPPAATGTAADESRDAGTDDAQAGPDGGTRYQRDLADLDRRIAEMSLVDDPGTDAAPAPPAGRRAAESEPAGATAPGAVMVFAGIGGPDAVRQFLGGLPDGFPRPVLVQQRLDGGRHDRLVQQMARATGLPVQLAEDGATAAPGHVYILPAELGVVAGGQELRFAAAGAGDSIAALPAEGSAVLLFSGADPGIVDAAMRQAEAGALVAGQSPEGCYDAEGPAAAQARGAESGQPAELASRIAARWKP